jgi:hypothetical protein
MGAGNSARQPPLVMLAPCVCLRGYIDEMSANQSGQALERVIAFTARQVRCKPAGLSERTTLCRDLGVDGQDGLDYLVAFEKVFGVDLSACRPDRHFGPEAGSPLAGFLLPLFVIRWLIRRIGWEARWLDWMEQTEEQAGLIPITLGDLATAAETRTWPFNYEDRPT